jgi:hypothetical protein
MKTIILISALLIFSVSFVSGQSTGSIKGKVIEKGTKLPISNAHVYIEIGGQKVGTLTNLDGEFHLKTLQSGTHELHVVSMGFSDYVLSGINVFPGRPTFLDDIKMQDHALTLGGDDGFVVKAEYVRKVIDPLDPTMKSLVAEEFENMPGNHNINEIVKTISPEIQMPDNGAGMIVRGARSGSSQYMLDGMKMENMSSVVAYSINSVSVYTGGIPAQYGDMTGGIIIIETKSYFDFLAQKTAKEKRKEEANQLE